MKKFPTAFTILFALIVVVAALTWIIPAGQYERAMNETLGREAPVPGTYAQVEQNPQGLVAVTMSEKGTKRLVGVECVIDKDRATALLAREIGAEVFVCATDAEAVYLDWGKPGQRAIRAATPDAMDAHSFPPSMDPRSRPPRLPAPRPCHHLRPRRRGCRRVWRERHHHRGGRQRNQVPLTRGANAPRSTPDDPGASRPPGTRPPGAAQYPVRAVRVVESDH